MSKLTEGIVDQVLRGMVDDDRVRDRFRKAQEALLPRELADAEVGVKLTWLVKNVSLEALKGVLGDE
jgi:hypothetical protein